MGLREHENQIQNLITQANLDPRGGYKWEAPA